LLFLDAPLLPHSEAAVATLADNPCPFVERQPHAVDAALSQPPSSTTPPLRAATGRHQSQGRCALCCTDVHYVARSAIGIEERFN
jgi:hypothetical protein